MFYVTMISILCVATGGAIGALLRYGVINLVQHFYPQLFPFGTMLVNIAGSFVVGLMMVRYLQHDSELARIFFITGVLGGFTTFSAFSWDALQMLQRGQLAAAGMYVLGTVFFSLVAVAAGFQLGR